MCKMYLIEPENKTGSCGIMAKDDLNLCKGTVWISTSSMYIWPDISIKENNPRVKDDLPLPVRPQIPTLEQDNEIQMIETSYCICLMM